MALQIFFHAHGVYYKFMQDAYFSDVHNTLDNQMKHLSKIGLIAKKDKARPFTQDEDHIWELRILGESNPEQLLNTVIFLLGIHLSLHTVDEHKSLKMGYYSLIKVKFDKKLNCKYLKYVEQRLKNHQGGTKDFQKKPKVVTAYANIDQPSHCVVHLYEKYVSLQPSHDPKCSHDLYLRPLKRYSKHV